MNIHQSFSTLLEGNHVGIVINLLRKKIFFTQKWGNIAGALLQIVESLSLCLMLLPLPPLSSYLNLVLP